MTIVLFTWLAMLFSFVAMFFWGMAAWRNKHGRWWGWVCFLVMLFCAWFAAVYAGILAGVLESEVVGQLYLRPAMIGFLLLSAGTSMRFWID